MRFSIKSKEDFLSGLLFIGFGLLAVIVARDYPMGTAMRMGPGYFPTYLGGLLILMGTAISMRSLITQGGTEPSHGFGWRALIMLSIAFAAFGISMEVLALGFIPSLVILILIAVSAGREFHPVETAILLVVLVAAAVGIFIYGIDLPFQLWWS